jgi:esterase/lipase
MRMPGSAEPIQRMAQVTTADWRAEVSEEMRRLRSSHEKVIVVGHSLGGTLAIDHLLRAPGDADALVLLAPLLRVSDERSPVLTAKAWFNVGQTMLRETQVLENFLPRDSARSEGEVSDRSDRFITRNIYENMFQLIAEVQPRAADLEHPLLVVMSERDEVVDGRAIEEFFEASRSRPKALLRAAEAGHMIQFDPGWEDVAAAIVSLVDGLGDGSAGGGSG